MAKEPDFNGEEMHLPNKAAKLSGPSQKVQNLGRVLLLLIVIAACALVYYFYFYKQNPVAIEPTNLRPSLETNKEPETPTAIAEIQAFSTLSTSNELGPIEADLLGTDLTNLETEIPAIDSELRQSGN